MPLLPAFLTLMLIVQPTKALDGPVYIMADGSIDPTGAPIQQNGDIYTVTGNIGTIDSSGIVIERDNMTLDGAGYTIQRTESASTNQKG